MLYAYDEKRFAYIVGEGKNAANIHFILLLQFFLPKKENNIPWFYDSDSSSL